MRILVAGAGGAIGGHLTKELVRQNHEVLGVDIKPYRDWWQQHGISIDGVDLRDRNQVKEIFEENEFDMIYNLAADMGGIGFITSHKVDCMLSSLINTNLLLEATEGTTYFYSSSACVYAAQHQDTVDVPPLAEWMAYPAMPEEGYGEEKLFSERMCEYFREERGIDTRVARYHNVYGTYGTWQGGREKAPAAICRKIATAELTKDYEIDVWGDGEQTRSFMWVGDCVRGTQMIANSDILDPINLGSSELVTINELIDMVETVAKVTVTRNYQDDMPQGVRGRNSDNTLIRQHLDWEPDTPLYEGLCVLYDWVRFEVERSL